MVYLFLANGFEECEALVPLDILRRSHIDVKTVGIGKEIIVGAHSIIVKADITDSEIVLNDSLSAVILPGGMPGTDNLEKCESVIKSVKFANDRKKLVCAICAAPKILGTMGLLHGKTATCFPGFENYLTGASLSENTVVCDTNIITAKGAGVAFQFGFEILKNLTSSAETEKLMEQMQYGGL